MKYIIFYSFFFLNSLCQNNTISSPIDLEKKELNIQKVIQFDNIYPQNIKYYQGALYIQDGNEDSDFNLKVLNLKTNKIDSVLKKGSNEYETLSAYTFGAKDHFFWVYDIVTKKITKLFPTENFRLKEIQLPELTSKLHFINQDTIIQLLNLKDTMMYSVVDLNSKHKLQQFGNLPVYASDTPKTAIKHAYDGIVFYNDQTQQVVTPYRYAQRIDFFTFGENSSKSVFIEESLPSSFDVLRVGNSLTISTWNKKTHYSFTSGDADNECIFLLYSGNHHKNDEYSFQGKYIFKFDWNGNILNKIELPFHVNSITIGNDNSELYISETSLKTIYKLKFNE